MTPADRVNRIAAQERERKLAELKEMWADLIEAEEAAFQRCCELDRENSDKTAEKAEAVRYWWNMINSVLWMFNRTRAQYDHELQPFPMFVLGRLANVSEEVSNGIIPSIIEDARGGRGRPWRLRERRHIAYGVLYIEAVRRGEIDDKAPNQTVRRAFNVTAKAVQGWMKQRNNICVGVPFKHLTPEELRRKMFECGGVYSRVGRGAPFEN
jgi:hypothetical protein